MAELEDGSGKRRVSAGTRSITGKLAERAVDNGQSWSVGFHKLGPRGQQVGYTWATINFGIFRRYFASTSATRGGTHHAWRELQSSAREQSAA
jgi:hypothetical protein